MPADNATALSVILLMAKDQDQGVAPLHAPQPFEHTTFVTLVDPDGRHVRVMTPWGSN